MKNYIENDRVLREEIASDICEGILTREDIKKLVSDQKIVDSFIGTIFESKTGQENWNERYLEKLPNFAVAQSFNEDYLYYLADVSEFVKKKNAAKNNNKWLWIIIVVAVIAIVAFVFIASNSQK